MAKRKNQVTPEHPSRLTGLEALAWAATRGETRNRRAVTIDAADWTYHTYTVTARQAKAMLKTPGALRRSVARLSESFDFDFRPLCRFLQTGLSAELERGYEQYSPTSDPVVILCFSEGTPLASERARISGTKTTRIGRAVPYQDATATTHPWMLHHSAFCAWAKKRSLRALRQKFIQEYEGENSVSGDSFAVFVEGIDEKTGITAMHTRTGSIVESIDPATGQRWPGSTAPGVIVVVAWPDGGFAGYSEILLTVSRSSGAPMSLQVTHLSSLERDRVYKPWLEGPIKDAAGRYSQLESGAAVNDESNASLQLDIGRERIMRNPVTLSEMEEVEWDVENSLVDYAHQNSLHRHMDSSSPPERLKPSDEFQNSGASHQPIEGTVDPLRDFRDLLTELNGIHDRFAERLQELFKSHAGVALSTPERAIEFRTVVNELLDRLDRRLQLPDGEQGRLTTTPNRSGTYYIRYNRSTTGTAKTGAPAETIPKRLRLSDSTPKDP
ncbi:MAG: hypothetical protein ACFHWZ_15255 [Phycisphaerales bacterium]